MSVSRNDRTNSKQLLKIACGLSFDPVKRIHRIVRKVPVMSG